MGRESHYSGTPRIFVRSITGEYNLKEELQNDGKEYLTYT